MQVIRSENRTEETSNKATEESGDVSAVKTEKRTKDTVLSKTAQISKSAQSSKTALLKTAHLSKSKQLSKTSSSLSSSKTAQLSSKTVHLSKTVEELGEDVNDEKLGDEESTDGQQSDYDPYKCDIGDEDEDEENDVTFAPSKRVVKKKQGRPCKATGVVGGVGASNTAKKSRLKLVKKAIAKVKGDKTKKFEKPKCSKCDYVGLSLEKLDQHMKKAHKDDTVRCFLLIWLRCQRSFDIMDCVLVSAPCVDSTVYIM